MSGNGASEAIPPEELLLHGFQAVRRVDSGERAWTYFAEGRERLAALKVWNPRLGVKGLIEESEAGTLNHPCIPDALELGKTHSELYFYIREWVDGVTLDELLSNPPSCENTTRLCRALLRLAESIASLHRGQYGPSRVHNAINGRNVLVTPEDDVRLINFDRSHLADVPALEPTTWGAHPFYVLTTDSESSKRRDLDSLLELFRRLWEPLGARVVFLDAVVPRPIADLHDEVYESVNAFRADLEIALTIAGIAPSNTQCDTHVR